jgi:hypothetical protein
MEAEDVGNEQVGEFFSIDISVAWNKVLFLYKLVYHCHGSILLTTASKTPILLMLLHAYLCTYEHLFYAYDFYALLMLLTFAACLCTSVYAYGLLCLLMHAYVGYLFAYGLYYQ